MSGPQGPIESSILFVSAGGDHDHLRFSMWKSAGGDPQPEGVTGLHHRALNVDQWSPVDAEDAPALDAPLDLQELLASAPGR
jgi:catechol-2,3-dioxygenase